MAIDKKNKILFIHPDKCAGKSIEQQLFNFTWGSGMRGSHHYHLDAGHYFGDDTFQHSQVRSDEIDDYYKFVVVRNPWDRCVSRYLDAQRRFNVKEKNFQEYLGRWYKSIPTRKDWYAQANCSDMISIDGEIKMERIIRFENLKDDWHLLLQDLYSHTGDKSWLEKELIHINKNKDEELPTFEKKTYVVGDYHSLYNEYTIDMVNEMYDIDIKYWGYTYHWWLFR